MKQDKSRVPAFLAALLCFTVMLLGLRCWTLSNENTELETQASAIAEALQISVAAQDSCALATAAAHRSEKRLLDELAKLRIQWEKLRGQVAQNKPRLEEGELCASAKKECSEQLLSSRQSDEAKDGVIQKLRTDAQRLRSDSLDLVACREQLEQTQMHSKLLPLQNEYTEDSEAIHRDAESRGAVGKRNKGTRRKKKRPHVIVEEPVEEVKKVDDDMPTEELGDDEDVEARDVVIVDEPVERVAVPRRSRSTTTTTTTEIPLAADEVQEEVVSKSTTAARGVRPMVRMVV